MRRTHSARCFLADALCRCRGWLDYVKLKALDDKKRRFLKDDTLTIAAELEVRLRRTSLAAPAAQKGTTEGYDEKLFVQPPVAATLCTICLGVMNDPVCCPEGHKCAPVLCQRLLLPS